VQEWVGLIYEIMNVKSWVVLILNHVTKQITNKKLGVARLRLAFRCTSLKSRYLGYVSKICQACSS